MSLAWLAIFVFVVGIGAQMDRWMTVDDFGQISNDSLMAHVDHFHDILDKRDDAVGLVVLYGPRLAQYLNQRRIEGCSRWRKRPTDRFTFVFGPEDNPSDLQGKFIIVTKEAKLAIEPPDYKLLNLSNPVELSKAFATDEYCPLYFDLEWYAHFLSANPTFKGKAIFDTSRRGFLRRVSKYRKRLASLDIKASRVQFFRRHFMHERNEQWWLIPPAKK